MVIANSRARTLGFSLLSALAMGCQPTFEDRNSEVLDRRVLAVQVTPAQAKPGAEVTVTALVVEPTGTLTNVGLNWAFCTAPKPVAETNDVAASCLEASGEQFQKLGRGLTVTGKLPEDACRNFGPDVPQTKTGEVAGRPTDADSTGSYYQPLRIIAPNGATPIVAIAQAGLTCGLPTLTGEQLLEYQKKTRDNAHPQLTNVFIDGNEDRPLSVDDGKTEPVHVAKGERITLRATWPSCPTSDACGDGICGAEETVLDCPNDCTTPQGCAGAETYIYYDPLTRSLGNRRESMRVAWFSGSGSFGDDHTGRREDETDAFSDGVWTAPNLSGPAHLWVVLRDSRSGVSWQSYVVEVD